jgi:hypothetical protein
VSGAAFAPWERSDKVLESAPAGDGFVQPKLPPRSIPGAQLRGQLIEIGIGTICIVNNEGGSLFDLFGLNRLPEHRTLIRNPSGANFEAIAAAFGQPYRRCSCIGSLRDALAESPTPEQIRIIEMVVPAGSLLRDLDSLYSTAAGLKQN